MTIFISLIALGLMIWVHELGHYLVARACGVHILRFSIGFGPKLLAWRNNRGCEFRLAVIPLGGYVQMLELGNLSEPDHEVLRPFCFQSKSLRQRAAIIAAGPLANILLATVLVFLIGLGGTTHVVPKLGPVPPESPAAIAGLQEGQIITSVDQSPVRYWSELKLQLIGRLGDSGVIAMSAEAEDGWRSEHQLPIDDWLNDDVDLDPLISLGLNYYQPSVPAQIAEVLPASAGDAAGLQAGDRVLSVNGQVIADWQQWAQSIRSSPGLPMLLTLERGGNVLSLELVPAVERDPEGMLVGVAGVRAQLPAYPPELLVHEEGSIWNALRQTIPHTYRLTATIFIGLHKLITGQLSLEHISGPITIVRVIDDSIASGLRSLLNLCAYLSLSLAILNLLPIPVLDGGHLVLLAIEAVKGRPLNAKIVRRVSFLGLAFLLGLMIFATYNDLLRL